MTDSIKCPVCGSRTLLGTSRKDGNKYYVCVNWPDCKGKVAYDDEFDWGDDWGNEKPVARAPQHRTPQRTKRPRDSSRNDLTWFQRNLHWTLVLAVIGGNLLLFIVGFLARPLSIDAYMWLMIVGSLLVFAFQGYVGFWVCSRKERSFWWMLLFYIPFGWIVLLRLDDRSPDSRYTR